MWAREMLRALGCELGQGWFLGRPAPPADLVERFRAGAVDVSHMEVA